MSRSALRAVLAMFLVALASSCGAKNAEVVSARTHSADVVQAYKRRGGRATAPDGDRLLVTTASMDVVVASVPAALEATTEMTVEVGGYVQESVSEKDDAARLKLRIPASHLPSFLDRIASLGEEKRREVSSEDVTESIADLEAELANKRALRDRLRALLGRAKDVKDVLAVENELTRLQTEIDSLEGRLKRLRTDVEFSAVGIVLRPREPEKERRILGPLGYLYVGTKWFVTKLFVIRPGEP